MASTYADQAIQLREYASISEHDLAAATGAEFDAVRGWLDGRATPTRAQAERLVELAVIVQRRGHTMRPEAIPAWLNAPVPALDERRPLELIAAGDYERVARLVSSFESRSSANRGGAGHRAGRRDRAVGAASAHRRRSVVVAAGSAGRSLAARRDRRRALISPTPPRPWAEWYRWLAATARRPLDALPRDLRRYRIQIDRIADLSTPDRLATAGLPGPEPDASQWPAFQAVGERLHAAGWSGVLYPSAARPAARALCLFRSGRDIPSVRPAPPPIAHVEPPVPPRGLRT